MTTQPPAQELPELPKNVQHIMRRIRACEGDEAARIVLEHALREYGRACIAASPAGRAAEKGWTQERGYHALVQVIYELQNDGSYSDDEGEETLALTDLVLRMEEADATPPLEVRESAKCGYCGGSGSVNSWTTATSSDICFKCNGAGTATAKGE